MATAPPRWDLRDWFPDFGADFDAWLDACLDELDDLAAKLAALGAVDPAELDAWATVLTRYEDLVARLGHASSYSGARSAADAADRAAKAAIARISSVRARSSGVWAKIVAALGQADQAAFDTLCAHPDLKAAAYRLRRYRARHALAADPETEQLASELGVDGIQAWGRLYRQVTSQMSFDLDGETVPLAWLRGSLTSPDRTRRLGALKGATAALESQGTVFAACLNAIAGTRITLDARRGVPDPLDLALFDAAIEPGTLDAMMQVVGEHARIGQRYLRLKAQHLGLDDFSWADVRAPLGSGARIPWADAQSTVLDAFDTYHPDLGGYARSMLAASRVEAEPRIGKRPGAFCTSSYVDRTSRVFMSYTGAAGDVRTLAHELGHAFHNHVMSDMRPWQRMYPMTLAETASIVAETLVSDAHLARPDLDRESRLQVLDARLGQVAVYLLDIPTRLAFERRFYALRRKGEVSIERLCALMHETQLEVFGDALGESGTHPWFWAEKLHFFMPGRRFYNFPYTFGYLFGQGVLARSRAEGSAAFHPTYIELLRRTGSGTAEEVAADVLGVDLGQPDFWRAALTGAEADLKAFEALVG